MGPSSAATQAAPTAARFKALSVQFPTSRVIGEKHPLVYQQAERLKHGGHQHRGEAGGALPWQGPFFRSGITDDVSERFSS